MKMPNKPGNCANARHADDVATVTAYATCATAVSRSGIFPAAVTDLGFDSTRNTQCAYHRHTLYSEGTLEPHDHKLNHAGLSDNRRR